MLGDEHVETLRAMGNLASLYSDQGRYDEAETLRLEVLEKQRHVLGTDHLETLRSMNNLTILYRIRGRYDEAERLYIETLETQKRVLGHDHPDTLTIMMNLANLYRGQGRYDQAEPLQLEVLGSQKRVLGDHHPSAGLSLYNLACLYALRGDRAKALDCLQQSVEAGWANAGWLSKDNELESLHGPEFDALVERARQNAAAQRANSFSSTTRTDLGLPRRDGTLRLMGAPDHRSPPVVAAEAGRTVMTQPRGPKMGSNVYLTLSTASYTLRR